MNAQFLAHFLRERMTMLPTQKARQILAKRQHIVHVVEYFAGMNIAHLSNTCASLNDVHGDAVLPRDAISGRAVDSILYRIPLDKNPTNLGVCGESLQVLARVVAGANSAQREARAIVLCRVSVRQIPDIIGRREALTLVADIAPAVSQKDCRDIGQKNKANRPDWPIGPTNFFARAQAVDLIDAMHERVYRPTGLAIGRDPVKHGDADGGGEACIHASMLANIIIE